MALSVPTRVVGPAVPAPAAPVKHAPNNPVFNDGPDHDVPSPRRRAATQKAYAPHGHWSPHADPTAPFRQ